jgi:hypothetical protein
MHSPDELGALPTIQTVHQATIVYMATHQEMPMGVMMSDRTRRTMCRNAGRPGEVEQVDPDGTTLIIGMLVLVREALPFGEMTLCRANGDVPGLHARRHGEAKPDAPT